MSTFEIICIILFATAVCINVCYVIYNIIRRSKCTIIYRGWVAVDKNGKTFCYKEKPERGNFFWIAHNCDYVEIHPINNLNWDDEPAEMVIISSK